MQSTTPTTPVSHKMLWTGRVISAIPILVMGVGGIFFAIFRHAVITHDMAKYGYPPQAATPIVIAEIACAFIYAIPQTSVLGAILLTGYLGGATATHVHAGEPFFFPLIFGVLVWLGLLLRDARLRALLPLRR